MSLLELKQHLMQSKVTTLGKIAAHFHRDPELIRAMLGHWLRKGCLRLFKTGACGVTCSNCRVSDEEIYEWL